MLHESHPNPKSFIDSIIPILSLFSQTLPSPILSERNRRNSHLMAMPVDSNSSPLALCKDDDSVENEKDFDQPTKKLKVDRDLAGEEDNTDSVPKVENEKDFAKLEDSVPPKVASLTEQEREVQLYKLYQRFKEFYQKEYDQELDERRFRVFKQNLERPQPTTTHSKFAINRPGFADLTPDEYACFQPRGRFSKYYLYCSTSVSDLEEMLAEHNIDYPPLTYY